MNQRVRNSWAENRSTVLEKLARSKLIIAALLLTSWLLMQKPDLPLTSSDSPGYLDFAPFRTAGYPLFLDFFGSVAMAAQVILFGLSAFVLSSSVERLTNIWVSLILILALFVNPEVARLHHSILTESLFLSLDCLILATAFFFLGKPRARWLLVAGLLCGLAAAVRPAAVALIAIPLAAGLINRHWRGILFSLLAFAAVFSAERVYSAQVHGANLTSLSGRHLFAKAALIEAAPVERKGYSALENRLLDALEQEYQPVRSLLLSTDRPIYTSLLADYEVCIQWACQAGLNIGQYPRRTIDDAMKRVALDRIANRPSGYLALAWQEYIGLWSMGSRTHPSIAPHYDAFMVSIRPVPLESLFAQTGALEPTVPRAMARIARPLFHAMGFALALILLVAVYRRWWPVAISALSVQACFVFVAVTAVGYGRYTVALWPNMMVAVILFGYFVIIRAQRSWL